MNPPAHAPQPSLADQISPWVLQRLQNALRAQPQLENDDQATGVHYEASLYGPFCSLFTEIFPSHRKFMIKPQGLRLRREYDAAVASDRGSTGSDWRYLTDFQDPIPPPPDALLLPRMMRRSSYLPNGLRTWMRRRRLVNFQALWEGVTHLVAFQRIMRRKFEVGDISRDSAGGIVGKKAGSSVNPDFIIAKATETLVDDTILAIVEIKVAAGASDLIDSTTQITEYMKMVAPKRRDPKLKGYLMDGSKIHVWQFKGAGADIKWDKIATYPMDLNRFKEELYSIARAHWQV
ncbi:hypothetical protein FPV67DRAFT_1652178 [Lyophyllum atratum]|nr:hypothetical protein FPV67DRAFT_1652178 [Lyophyllum atratum]